MSTYTGICNSAIIVGNIKELTNAVCDNLDSGDLVIKDTGGSKITYRVNYKTNSEMRLVYTDHNMIEEVYYVKAGGNWQYNKTEEKEIGSGTGTITINNIESDSFGIDSTIDTRIASNNSVFFSYHNVGVQVYNANDTSAFSEHTSSGMLSLNPIDLFDPTLIESLGTLGVAYLFSATGTDISSRVTWSDFVQMVIMAGSIALANPSTLQVTVLPLKEIKPNLNGSTSFYARYGNIDYNGNALEVCLLAVQSDNDIGDIEITINPAYTVTEREGVMCLRVESPSESNDIFLYIQRGQLITALQSLNIGVHVNLFNMTTVFNSLPDVNKAQLLIQLANYGQCITLYAEGFSVNIQTIRYDVDTQKLELLYLELNDADSNNIFPEVTSVKYSALGLTMDFIR